MRKAETQTPPYNKSLWDLFIEVVFKFKSMQQGVEIGKCHILTPSHHFCSNLMFGLFKHNLNIRVFFFP